MTNPRDDIVARQYERWRYPQPIADLDTWLQNNWQWFDPSHAQRLLWPDRAYRGDMDILIAGCGTNQAAVFAHNNREAKVLGVDVSDASLAHQRYLKQKHGLDNLELLQLPIEDLPNLGREFDLIVSTGVLHHMAEPLAGLRSLLACLRTDGVIGLMLYAKYGRIGIEILQSLFDDLGLHQDDLSVLIVREAIAALPPDHPVRRYISLAGDLQFDAVLVDTFLHGRARNYTVDDCIELVHEAGAAFQGWFFNAPYNLHDDFAPGTGFRSALKGLPDAKRWSAMERINTRNACHFFMVCKPERAAHSQRIDFDGDAALDYVPQLRLRCGLDGDDLVRPGWRMRLGAAQMAVMQQVDGQRNIRDIARLTAQDPAGARALFASLWRMDFLAMAITQ